MSGWEFIGKATVVVALVAAFSPFAHINRCVCCKHEKERKHERDQQVVIDDPVVRVPEKYLLKKNENDELTGVTVQVEEKQVETKTPKVRQVEVMSA